MDKKQENRQTMWETVEDVLDDNKATVDPIPSFAESVANFKTTAALARSKIQEADTMTKSKTKAKDDTVNDLIASLGTGNFHFESVRTKRKNRAGS